MSDCMDTIRSRKSKHNSLINKMLYKAMIRVYLCILEARETFTERQFASLVLPLAFLLLHHRPALPLVPLALRERALLTPTNRNRIGTESEQRF